MMILGDIGIPTLGFFVVLWDFVPLWIVNFRPSFENRTIWSLFANRLLWDLSEL